jgi:uncharacterized RDD family membrane protein YckC
MENVAINNHKTGFWIRFTATWIDLLIVLAIVKTIVVIFSHAGIYVPFELTFILFFVVYSSVLIGWQGRTIGKALCGLTVLSSKDKSIGYLRAFFRETIFKAVSAICLFLGFVWIGFSRRKRGWHDYIAQTAVKQGKQAIERGRWLLAAVLAINAAFLGPKIFLAVLRYNDAMRIAVEPNVITTYSQRDPSSLVEISYLERSDRAAFVNWLDENGKNPVDYVVEAASKHQITIFGEAHHIQDDLLFLNRIIPELYHRAGVTCVAMEVCVAEDNAKLAELVTSDQFDSQLALQIARDQDRWKAWGDKEYWDVFETVWKLNHTLPQGNKKMRVIGIDSKWDGPSFGLMGLSGESAGGPLWEKLRFFRLLDDLVLLLKRDEIMARNVEKEIIEKRERAIVWVGLNHDYINYRQPRVISGRVISEWGRMGFMLHQKYGEQVFHIRLHTSFGCPTIVELIEKAVAKGEIDSVGFDVVGSPFAPLRDKDSYYFRHQPGVCFSDIASGYVYLKPVNKLKRCQWLNGYISEEMFVKNKPYYEADCGRKLSSAEDANIAIASKYGLQLTN